jgi:hypothetical protein
MPEFDDASGHWPVERNYSSGVWHAAEPSRWSACIPFCSDWDLKIDRDAPLRQVEVLTSRWLIGCGCDGADVSNAKDHLEIVATDHDGASQPVTMIGTSEDHGAEHRWSAFLAFGPRRFSATGFGRPRVLAPLCSKSGRFY